MPHTFPPQLYADFNASAPLAPTVKAFLIERLQSNHFANPNSGHTMGQELWEKLEKARKEVALHMNCPKEGIIFQSGASEAIAHVFFSCFVDEIIPLKKNIIISEIEHSCVSQNALYWAKKFHQNLISIKVLQTGELDLEEFHSLMKDKAHETGLVSIMAANNESGVIQPYREMAQICQKFEVPFLCDTTQLIGKAPFDFEDSGADFAVASGHKFGAMPGSGYLMAKNPSQLTPMIQGGGQEGGLRSGTQNYLAIETLGVAVREFPKAFERMAIMQKARDQFEEELLQKIPRLMIFGKKAPRVATTSYLSAPNTQGPVIQGLLEKRNVYVTTSSACSDRKGQASRVLTAMGATEEYLPGALRVSLCLGSDPHEYKAIGQALQEALT